MTTGMEPFRNEPFTDFQETENKRRFIQTLKTVRGEFDRFYPLIIGGERVQTDQEIVSYNPARPKEIVGRVAQANVDTAERAMRAAKSTFTSWQSTSAHERSRYLFKTAALLRKQKAEFTAWLIYEAGKTWSEADGDVAEAIDFLEFYGREMLRLADGQPLTSRLGQQNELCYIPLGVCVVIAPWNFPLAILVGMTAAALVAGNTVVLKPASPTVVIACKFISLLEEAGLPDGVVNLVAGPGGLIGDYLVDHVDTRMVIFTGSRDVGVRIYERAAIVHPGQRWLKRVVAELGGKNTMIVDKQADLDAAAQAIVDAAFGFSGQKCSACSKAVIHEAVYETMITRVLEKARQWKPGDPADPDTRLGPVIHAGARDKMAEIMRAGEQEATLILGGADQIRDLYVPPTIFRDVPIDARLAQEEIFGPVLSFIRAESFAQALAYANDSLYGLTGAVYSNDRRNLAWARTAFHVGNLYFNRKSTGALVGVHPFGGFDMSGTDSKAGGRDYLLLFTQAKTISEQW